MLGAIISLSNISSVADRLSFSLLVISSQAALFISSIILRNWSASSVAWFIFSFIIWVVMAFALLIGVQ